MLPRKSNNGFYSYCCYLQCSYQQCESVQCCNVTATMGSIRIVVYLQCSYQQCKCSVLPRKSNNGFYSYCCYLKCNYQQCKSVQCCNVTATMGSIRIVVYLQCSYNHVSVPCCHGRATMGSIRIVAICNVATNNVKVFRAAMETPTTGSPCSAVQLRNIPYRFNNTC